MAKQTINEAREHLRKRMVALRDVLEGADEPTVYDQQTLAILGEVLDALDSLDVGAVPEIFRKGPRRHNTADPVEIRQIRRQAVFYVQALHLNRGVAVKDAIAWVADKYGRGPDAIDNWRRPIVTKGKSTRAIEEDRLAVRILLDHDRLWGAKRTKADILKMAENDGQRLKVLQTKPDKLFEG
jgi:hypothetical protein